MTSDFLKPTCSEELEDCENLVQTALDLDICELSYDAEAFIDYRMKARDEFRFLDDEVYDQIRAEHLKFTLNRGVVYKSSEFASKNYEAINNIKHELQELAAKR